LASVAGEAGAHSIIELAMERFGRIDALVNNAGIQVRQRIESVDEADFRRHLDIHLLGTYWLTRAAWPRLAAVGGRVVNTVSALLFGMEGYAAYTAAKGGILGLSRALAVEGRERGIGVNCVAPGAATRLMTGPATGVSPGIAAQLEAALPATAVAEIVAYLAHPACTLQGECISVAGNHVSRYLLAETAGVRLGALTAEAFRDAVGEVLDPSQLSIWKDTAAITQASQAAAQLASLPQTGVLPTR
jgi:NAD(P)-dependent dehydrogenase (short-subunit alcohol dehydrogenase family)